MRFDGRVPAFPGLFASNDASMSSWYTVVPVHEKINRYFEYSIVFLFFSVVTGGEPLRRWVLGLRVLA